ncbi:MAG: hypothetical protein QM767_04685 [Anaeromyxobacter sp.]
MLYWITGESVPEGRAGEFVLDGSQYRRTAPLAAQALPITTSPAGQALVDQVATYAGAAHRLDCSGRWVANRDVLDRRIVNDLQGGTGPRTNASDCTGSTCLPQSEINTPEGNFPTFVSSVPCADADHDGMPDAYELARALNPNDASDGKQVGSDGYTNLERYLAGTW